MSHIISLNVTKFQQPLLITLGVADKKPERGGKRPPRDIGLRASWPIQPHKHRSFLYHGLVLFHQSTDKITRKEDFVLKCKIVYVVNWLSNCCLGQINRSADVYFRPINFLLKN